MAFGDNTWWDYEVRTIVTFHAFTAPVKGPPTYNVSHAAIASRWPADDEEPEQWDFKGIEKEENIHAGSALLKLYLPNVLLAGYINVPIFAQPQPGDVFREYNWIPDIAQGKAGKI